MKRLLVFMLIAVLIISCSSKKILSLRKIAHNGVINNIASQYDFSQKQYSTLSNLKNSSVKNLSEVEASIPTVKNNKDLLASKDKVEPTALINNYSYNSPQIIQKKRINKSLNENLQIFENKKSSLNNSKVKNKTRINLGQEILGYDPIRDYIEIVLLLTLTTIVSLFTFFVVLGYGWFYYGNFFQRIFTPLGSIFLLISSTLIYCSFRSIKKMKESNLKDDNKDEVKESTD